MVFYGYLREEQATASAIGRHQSVTAYDDVYGSDFKHGREDADLDLQGVQLWLGYRREAGVFQGCGASGSTDGLIEGLGGDHVANASS